MGIGFKEDIEVREETSPRKLEIIKRNSDARIAKIESDIMALQEELRKEQERNKQIVSRYKAVVRQGKGRENSQKATIERLYKEGITDVAELAFKARASKEYVAKIKSRLAKEVDDIRDSDKLKEQILQHYYHAKFKQVRIVEELGVSKQYVSKVIKKYGREYEYSLNPQLRGRKRGKKVVREINEETQASRGTELSEI